MDSTTIGITGKARLSFFGHLRLYERGEFQWDDFAERPLEYFEDRTLVGAIFYTLKEGLLFSVGIRYFSQSRYGFSGQERQFQSIFRSSGPLTTVDWHLSGRTDFLVTGWYEHQSQTGSVSRNFANLTMSLVVHL
jgi:hypothetical protein